MNYVAFLPYYQALVERAREMRSNPTAAEKKLWEEVLKAKKLGFKFSRQKPIDQFIVDFYCSELKLAIEVDGDIHDLQKEYDEQRSLILECKYGVKILRFSNHQVLSNIKQLEKDLIFQIKKMPPL